MPRKKTDRVKVSVYLGDIEIEIVEALATQWSVSTSAAFRRLLLEHGKQLIGDFDKSSEV